jgi:putrescine---pyruvate transaminase
MTPSSLDTADLRKCDAAHHMHPFSDFGALKREGSRVITRGKGVYIWDSDGNKILDAMAGLWCVNVGYGRREIADAAYAQMLDLPYYNTFFKTTTAPAARLAELLAELTPANLDHVFFTSSGSEANDTIVRMARHYWACRGMPEKKTIISRRNGYHGSSVASASLGGMPNMHAQGGLPIPDIVHVDQPYWFGEAGDLTPEALGLRAARSIETKIQALGEDRVAAFIAEPFQGAGGVIIPPDSYWPEVARILSRYDVLLVIDEVIAGFGRTGEWFGSQYYGLSPDLMPMAKGMSSGYLPIGGVMIADRVAQVLAAARGDFNHGYTYSGHPACAAAAIANIEILRREGIVDRVRTDTAPYLQRRWRELAGHPIVGEARGLGMVAAIEISNDRQARTRFPRLADGRTVGMLCRDRCIGNGLVMRACGDTMIIAPPLVISHGEIDELIDKATRSLDETAERLG